MLEDGLGFNGQVRVVIVHQKGLREHVHVVWSRVDIEHSRAIPNSWNYRVHEEVARSPEALFGHRPVQRSSAKRLDRAGPRVPRDYELRQEERSGTPVARVTKELTHLWQASSSSRSFREKLEEAGYQLARGDRRVLVVIDRNGEVHSLARRLEGISTKDMQEQFQDTHLQALPSVADVRARYKAKRLERHPKKNFAPAAKEVTVRRLPPPGAARATPRPSPSISSSREAFIEITGFAALSLAPKPLRVPFHIAATRGSSRYRTARAIIIADYATKIANARRNFPAHELDAAFAALLAEREAALSAIARQQGSDKTRPGERIKNRRNGGAARMRGARRRFRLRHLVRLSGAAAFR